ncbi:peptide/nickel transport system permease protein [Pullulanibacillus pueri]|uniref:ABC transporter permease n=1 Tax=Pullulanibacillus pueri TaxID=1437324 RepID=A0A8J2ZX75_9BACL|nr:ABC transporter permease [Pullulanibacillus pueri]MBM7682620.1 peptide/nickel transport system permease protein [Pullulanibacillus pueri]GGH82537.1 ABC transporter permease [Pullulanibacillus pueri]
MLNESELTNPSLLSNEIKEDSLLKKVWLEFYKNRIAFIALIVLGIVVLSCLLAPLIAPFGPLDGEITDRLLPLGSTGHILGTDEQGRDMLTRVLYGGRLSLYAGFLPVVISIVIGGALGVIAGYFGRILNTIIMRTLDIFYSFPAILLAIGISAALGQGINNIVISISIIFIPPVARVAESAVKGVREEEFIEAAKSSGAQSISIIRYHVIKNIFAKVFVYGTTQISISLVLASGLSFLGLGVSPPTPEWGIMLNNLKGQIFINPLVTIIPGLFIFITALTINLVADGLRDALEINS